MPTLSMLLRHPDLPRSDSRVLLGHATGLSHAQLLARGDTVPDVATEQHFARLVARRLAGEPVAYLLEERAFFNLTLRVTPAVLIPRPETELLVDTALRALAERPQARVLDLGTGSGAIALALQVNAPQAEVWAVDVSAAALEVAHGNQQRYPASPVVWRSSDWYEALAGERFDVIVSNPPYIAAGDPHLQQGDLRFEPASALTDHGDGLSHLRRIIAGAPAHLHPGGCLWVEHGYDQAAACRELLLAAGGQDVCSLRDLAGIERISGAVFRH
jgi:release factor glutamine methyltransferase